MEQREAARKMGSRFAKTIEKLGLSISETEFSGNIWTREREKR